MAAKILKLTSIPKYPDIIIKIDLPFYKTFINQGGALELKMQG
jgi:hypothetical protein